MRGCRALANTLSIGFVRAFLSIAFVYPVFGPTELVRRGRNEDFAEIRARLGRRCPRHGLSEGKFRIEVGTPQNGTESTAAGLGKPAKACTVGVDPYLKFKQGVAGQRITRQ